MRGETLRSWDSLPRKLGLAALVAMLLLAAVPASAIDHQSGKFRISWDNTLSWGAGWRLEDPDTRIIGLANGGTAYSVNGDDGNLNYEKGLFSNAVKWTSELEVSYKNVGAFVRGFAFYDYENEEGDRARSPLSEEALDRVGSRAELRDAFLWFKFNLGQAPVELRVGDQVVNWGESTFIQNGINVINPVDVSVLRVPGAELRDALLPVGMGYLSLGLSQNLALQMFYQYQWEETIIDPTGTYFSTTDLAGPGASRVMLGFGSVPDTIPIVPSPTNPIGAVVQRSSDREASDDGQFGVALRWFAPGLGGTEFGLYYMNYHSRLPVINAITGTAASPLPPVPPFNGSLNYASTARYFLSYPEDIKLYGLSFNNQLGNTGVALQGEYSYRQDVPLQVDDLELLYAALTPLRLINLAALPPSLRPAYGRLVAVGGLLAATNQVGAYGWEEEIEGYRRFDTSQLQMTGTKVFSGFLGADQFVMVAEAAAGFVHDFPEKEVLRLEGPGTYVSGNPIHQQYGIQPHTEEATAFPDELAWGYVLAGRWDYNNAIGAINLSPRFSWAHDVSGLSPGPGGNFVEGRNALTLGLAANYRINWEFDVSYTQYNGANRYNLINDRDFVAANVKFSF
jgi:hypothetical protein